MIKMSDFKLENVHLIKVGGRDGQTQARDMPHYEADNSRIMYHHYPNCCTGAILSGFGGSEDSYDDETEESFDSLLKEVSAWVDYIASSRNKAFISACVTEQQDVAIEVLESLGFELSSEIENNVNSYDLRLYTLSINKE